MKILINCFFLIFIGCAKVGFCGDLVNNELIIGSGKITGSVINNGTISPNGIIEVTENFTANVGSQVNIDITSISVFDAISITSLATWGGSVSINLLNGFTPIKDNTFKIFTFGVATGAFKAINLPPLNSPLVWYIDYNVNDITLRVDNAIALPVTLLNFTAKSQNNNTALLNWQTTNSTNMSTFEVLRSTNAQIFENIGIVTANNGKETLAYDFVDTKPKIGINYYKLKMLELVGKYSYSKIQSVDFIGQNKYALFPNPAKNELNIHTGENETEVIVNSSDGKFIEKHTGNDIILNIKNYTFGTYLIQFVSKNGIKTDKFIKE